ncbi:MAG TPA: hypothetical protein PKD34_01805 [Candidatus Doudnabacteria bacterium]|nr:hypothetical protein [Candidatus Doudnabacteria bacterium]
MNEEIKPKIEFSPEQVPTSSEVMFPEKTDGEVSTETSSPETQTSEQSTESHEQTQTESSDQVQEAHAIEGVEPHTLHDHHNELAREKVYASSSDLESVGEASELMDLANLIEEAPTEEEKRARLNEML